MAKRRFPDLAATGRRYLAETQRARLASQGLERFRVQRPRHARALVLAALALLALIGLMVWLVRRT